MVGGVVFVVLAVLVVAGQSLGRLARDGSSGRRVEGGVVIRRELHRSEADEELVDGETAGFFVLLALS
jgi:Na+-transporting methylmalonyl-CoA/oxaloacetate decarboxylase gamma subunit